MKSAVLAGVGLVLAGMACNPEQSLSEVLENKRCRALEPQCVDGYECDTERGICVPRVDRSDAGAAGASDPFFSNGAGGMPQVIPMDGDPPLGGEGGAAGAVVAAAGAGAASSSDPVAGDAGAGCTKQRLFLDRDGDGYGSTAPEDTTVDCPSAGWVDVGGDCLDAAVTAQNHANEVHPGQTQFFAVGYQRDESGAVSFDYDCSLQEEPDPRNRKFPGGDCSAATPPCSNGIGFVPEDRSGPDVNNLCGSSTFETCAQVGNGCAPGARSTTTVFQCH